MNPLQTANAICDRATELKRRSRRADEETKATLRKELKRLRAQAKSELPRRYEGDYGHQVDEHLDTIERILRR